jgi:isocitrate lyase
MNNELMVVARTDALSAKLIDSNICPVDHPWILGMH